MNYITKFDDLSVLLPLSMFLSVFLWRAETKGAAFGFIKALVFCLSAMLMLKLMFLACDRAWRDRQDHCSHLLSIFRCSLPRSCWSPYVCTAFNCRRRPSLSS
jgi:hypothetical protein